MACPEGMETEKAFLEALQRFKAEDHRSAAGLAERVGRHDGSFEARHIE
jgi:hypothetical protein